MHTWTQLAELLAGLSHAMTHAVLPLLDRRDVTASLAFCGGAGLAYWCLRKMNPAPTTRNGTKSQPEQPPGPPVAQLLQEITASINAALPRDTSDVGMLTLILPTKRHGVFVAVPPAAITHWLTQVTKPALLRGRDLAIQVRVQAAHVHLTVTPAQPERLHLQLAWRPRRAARRLGVHIQHEAHNLCLRLPRGKAPAQSPPIAGAPSQDGTQAASGNSDPIAHYNVTYISQLLDVTSALGDLQN